MTTPTNSNGAGGPQANPIAGGAEFEDLPGTDGANPTEADTYSFIDQAMDVESGDVKIEDSPEFNPDPDVVQPQQQARVPAQQAGPQPVVQTPTGPVQQQAAQPPVNPFQQAAQQAAVQPNQGQPQAQVDQRDGFTKILEGIQAQKATFEQALAERVYKLDPKDVSDLEEGKVGEVIPRLMARSHMQIIESVIGSIVQQLPAYVGGMMQAQQQNARAEEQFYAAWPQLQANDASHVNMVTQIASVVNRMYPQADMATRVRMIGSQAVLALGLNPAAPNVNSQQQPQQVLRQPGRQVRRAPAPFAPAGAGTAPAAGVQPDNNQWSRFAEIISAEEQGRLNIPG